MQYDFLYIKVFSEHFLLCTIFKCYLILMYRFQGCVSYQYLTLKYYYFFMWLITGFWERNYFEYIIVSIIKPGMFTVLHRGGARVVVGEGVLNVIINLI